MAARTREPIIEPRHHGRGRRDGSRVDVALAALAFATALTWIAGLAAPPHAVLEVLLFAEGFPGAPERWSASGDGAVLVGERAVTLEASAARRTRASRTAPLPPRTGGRLRVSASIEALAGPVPASDEARAFASVRLLDGSGERVGFRSVLQTDTEPGIGSRTRLVDVPDGARRLEFAFSRRDTSGEAVFRLLDARAELVSETASHRVVDATLWIAWLGVAGVLAALCSRRLDRRGGFLLALTVAVVVAGVTLSESPTSAFAGMLRQAPALRTRELVDVFKLGHFAAFASLGVTVFALRSRLGLTRTEAVSTLVLIALASEGVQLHLDNRTARIADLGIDGGGILFAAGLCGIAGVLSRRRAARRASPVGGRVPRVDRADGTAEESAENDIERGSQTFPDPACTIALPFSEGSDVNPVPADSGWFARLRQNRLFMYGLIGGVASAIDVGLFVLLYEWIGVPALVAHSISIPASAVYSFVCNAWFNFRTTDRLLSRAGSFAVVVALGYALGALVIWVFVNHTPFGGTVGKLVSLPLVFVFQFVLNSRISFREHHAT